MKKVLIASAALFFAAFTSVNAQTAPASQPATDKKEVATAPAATIAATAGTATTTAPVAAEKNETAATAQQPAKTPVKTDALPEAVKTVLAGAEFKGWTVTSAFLVNAASPYYELMLTKEKESKTVKVDATGKLM